MRRTILGSSILLALSLAPLVQGAAKVSIAAAANLVYVLEPLRTEFARVRPDTTLSVTTGASGSLFAQIKHGAPFDVFLSADTPNKPCAKRSPTRRPCAPSPRADW